MSYRFAFATFAVCLALTACSSTAGRSASTRTTTAATTGTTGTTGTTFSTSVVTFPRSSINWPRLANQAAMINAAHLPPLPGEGSFEHYHAHIDVIIDGKSVAVPAGIGINIIGPIRFSPLHTHDATGILHIESATHSSYTLGEFFTEWNVRLTSDCIGSFCNGADRQMIVAVNGQAVTGDPSTIVFESHQEIAIWSSSPDTAPDLPSSYGFPRAYST